LTSTTSVTSATPHPAASPAATASRSGASLPDHGHRGAGARERGGDRAADPAAAAGHESMLARKRHLAWSPGGRGIAA